MQEQNPIVLMNFSGIYREEEFWKNRQVSWIELQDVCGTNCYCDEEAIAEINKRTENYPTAESILLIPVNYHYMTRLWLTRMDQPFCLLVYDNHTDMQPPALVDLSCGGWIAAALEELENLKYVILVGPDEAAYEQVDENLKDRVIFLSREKLQVMMMKRETGFSGKQSVKYVIGENRKVYRKMLKNSFHYIYLLIKMCFVQRMHRRHGARGI